GAGASLIVVGFFAILVGVGAWMTPTIRAQSVELRAKIPEAIDRIDQWMSRRRTGMLGALFGGSSQQVSAIDTTGLRADTGVARSTAIDDSARATGDTTAAAAAGPGSPPEPPRVTLDRASGGLTR